jgi:hypothetical protein
LQKMGPQFVRNGVRIERSGGSERKGSRYIVFVLRE